MTSMAAAYSQVPARSNYLVSYATPSTGSSGTSGAYEYVAAAGVGATLDSVVRVNSAVTAGQYAVPTCAAGALTGNAFSSVFTITKASYSGSTVTNESVKGTMYRDKGKRITVVDSSTGKHLAIFALVSAYAPESGGGATATNQGTAAGTGQIYVQVWDAFDPTRVCVAESPA